MKKIFADESYREQIWQAREMKPEEKLLAGARLFDRVCRTMVSGIRHQFPDASEEEVQRILDHRLEIAKRLEVRHG